MKSSLLKTHFLTLASVVFSAAVIALAFPTHWRSTWLFTELWYGLTPSIDPYLKPSCWMLVAVDLFHSAIFVPVVVAPSRRRPFGLRRWLVSLFPCLPVRDRGCGVCWLLWLVHWVRRLWAGSIHNHQAVLGLSLVAVLLLAWLGFRPLLSGMSLHILAVWLSFGFG